MTGKRLSLMMTVTKMYDFRHLHSHSHKEKLNKLVKMSIYLVLYFIGNFNVRFKIPARIWVGVEIVVPSFGVVGPAECGVKPVWLIDFWRTCKIQNNELMI